MGARGYGSRGEGTVGTSKSDSFGVFRRTVVKIGEEKYFSKARFSWKFGETIESVVYATKLRVCPTCLFHFILVTHIILITFRIVYLNVYVLRLI